MQMATGNTSYFHRLEKHHFCNKLISQLKVGVDTVYNHNGILDVERQYYEQLYSDLTQSDNNIFESQINSLNHTIYQKYQMNEKSL